MLTLEKRRPALPAESSLDLVDHHRWLEKQPSLHPARRLRQPRQQLLPLRLQLLPHQERVALLPAGAAVPQRLPLLPPRMLLDCWLAVRQHLRCRVWRHLRLPLLLLLLQAIAC